MVLIRLLGGVSATTDSGEPVDVGPAKCQTVLAALALAAGSAVPVPRLIDLVWGERPAHTAEKTLQSYVVRVRKGLGAASIVRIGAAYRLELKPESIDVARFQQLLDSGNIEAALAEWTGTPLAGLAGHGLTPMVDALVEQWLVTVETDLQRRLQTNPASIIGPLTELTASHPFRENLWSLLMTALYRVDRQADALDTFRKARRQLVDELGVEPGPRLRELESLILGHDERLRGPETPTNLRPGLPTGTVTFGFCEVEDASQLWSTHRKKMAAAVPRLDEIVRAAVDRHHGHVFATGGETFGSAFHRADDAAAWARELQLEVTSEPWPGGVELRLRIGIHTGETEERANSYFGPAVNAAARIAAAGHGRQILVSEVSCALLDRGDLLDLGTYRLDGELTALRLLQLDEGRHQALRTDDLRGNLPLRLDRLLGREKELDTIRRTLAHSPVVTLVGPGGIGKTRLALGVGLADIDRAGGVWLVELANIAAPADVPRAVADVLDVREGPGRTLTQSVIAALQSRSALLVLDNCEHVINGAAELTQAIAQGCPRIQVLATSREALGVSGEQLITVGPLDPGAAGVELFEQRARAVSATFDAAASRATVAEVCRRLDGVPLAIELAAARTRTLAPADLLRRLDQRLDLLTGGRRTSPERHRTLRATVQWSYDLLAPGQQRLFQRLSVFAGPFDLDDAGSVVADEMLDRADVDDLLEDLVEKSMLTVESGPFGIRFRLLETIGEYAAERLLEVDSTDRLAARHAQWCLRRVTDIHHLLVGPAEIEGVARLGQLWPNLRAAFNWACAQGDHRLAAALVRPVAAELNLRQQSEIREWAERILAITPADDEDRIVYWLTCATYGYKQNDDHAGYERLAHRYGRNRDHPLIRYTRAYLYDDGEALRVDAVEAVAWLRSHGEDDAAVNVEIGGVASALMSTGRFTELDSFVSILVVRYRAQGPPTLLYVTLAMLGYSAWFQGRAEEAERLFDESAGIEVPARTSSVNEPAQARKAFKSGHQAQAFRILRCHVQELLGTDYTDLARLAAVEFINMMAAIDRLPEAARILGYLAGTGDFGTLAVRALVADAARTIEAGADRMPGLTSTERPHLTGREALKYMNDVLDDLAVLPTDVGDGRVGVT